MQATWWLAVRTYGVQTSFSTVPSLLGLGLPPPPRVRGTVASSPAASSICPQISACGCVGSRGACGVCPHSLCPQSLGPQAMQIHFRKIQFIFARIWENRLQSYEYFILPLVLFLRCFWGQEKRLNSFCVLVGQTH